MTEETLFELACGGNKAALEEYWKKGGGLNIRYHRFGTEHSLTMGAFRNQQWDTVRWLLDHGAGLTDAEQDEVNRRYLEMALLAEMQNIQTENRQLEMLGRGLKCGQSQK